MIDGINGTTDWRKGNWQGYQKNDMEAVIDLQQSKNIHQVNIDFLQDAGAWIIFPKEVIVWVSPDGKRWQKAFTGLNTLSADDKKVTTKTMVATFNPVNSRYVKINAVQYGKLPSWHEGAGGDSHLFVDEITVQ